jgi:hypothetical protein
VSLIVATCLLAVAVAVGSFLAIGRKGGLPSMPLGAVHGFLGIAGLALLIYLVPGSHRGAATGSQSFGAIAAVLLGAAALVGLAMLALHWRARRLPGALVGIHATLAVSGFVILAVYAMLG